MNLYLVTSCFLALNLISERKSTNDLFYVSAACLLTWRGQSGNQVKQLPHFCLQEEREP
jgi:hypothetical protein